MSQDCFEELCHRIEDIIGSEEFKSEKFIHDLEATEPKNLKTMVHLHRLNSGSFVCGEIKVALSLRLLAGGSYLDLALLFGISTRHVHRTFHTVVDKWFLNDCLVKIDGVGYCMDNRKMEHFARGFCKSSEGVFAGVLELLMDGLSRLRSHQLKGKMFKILVPITV